MSRLRGGGPSSAAPASRSNDDAHASPSAVPRRMPILRRHYSEEFSNVQLSHGSESETDEGDPWENDPEQQEWVRSHVDLDDPSAALTTTTPVGPAAHNAFRLLSLPEEILLLIIHFVKDNHLQLLRSTCSTFLRLTTVATPRNRPQIWNLGLTPATVFIAGVTKYRPSDWDIAELRELLRRDLLCPRCRSLRRDIVAWNVAVHALQDKLLCSGCQVVHPRALFSAAQAAAPSWLRVCVGLEGHIRLCRHKVVQWDDLAAMRYTTRQLAVGSAQRDWRPSKFVSELVCDHKDHAVPLRASEHRPRDLSRPSAIATFEFTSSRERHLSVRLTSEMELPGPEPRIGDAQELPPQDRVDLPAELRKRVHTTATTFSDQLCAHIIAGQGHKVLPLMRLEHRNQHGEYKELDRTAQLPDQAGIRGVQKCATCPCSVEVTASQDETDQLGRLILRVSRDVSDLRHPTDDDWLAMLDPGSFGLVGDEDLRGLTWCDAPACSVRRGFRHHSRLINHYYSFRNAKRP